MDTPPEGDIKVTPPEDEAVKPKKKKRKAILRSNSFLLPSEMSDSTSLLVSETLKIIFSQTVNWKLEGNYDDVSVGHVTTKMGHVRDGRGERERNVMSCVVYYMCTMSLTTM